MIDNACAVLQQRSGWFNDWYATARKTEAKYGIPAHVLLATVRIESGFDSDARPPRTKILGAIPWTRPSSAYGYSQALNGTWEQYRDETGNSWAKRDDFAASMDFVGWYHAKTASRYGVAPDDAYALYLGYMVGWTGYGRGAWRDNPVALRGAAKTARMASAYKVQIASCDL